MKTNSQLEIVTTSNGYFKAGIKGRIIDGGERTVYLGPFGHRQKTKIPEFTLELYTEDGTTWKKHHCQYGRDFVFADSETAQSIQPFK